MGLVYGHGAMVSTLGLLHGIEAMRTFWMWMSNVGKTVALGATGMLSTATQVSSLWPKTMRARGDLQPRVDTTLQRCARMTERPLRDGMVFDIECEVENVANGGVRDVWRGVHQARCPAYCDVPHFS